MKPLARFVTTGLALLLVCVGFQLNRGDGYPQYESGAGRMTSLAELPLGQGVATNLTVGVTGGRSSRRWIAAPIGYVRLDSERLARRGRRVSGKLMREGFDDLGVLRGDSLSDGARRVTLFGYYRETEFGQSYWALVSDLNEQGQRAVVRFGLYESGHMLGGWEPIAELESARGGFDGQPGFELRYMQTAWHKERSFFALDSEDAEGLDEHQVSVMRALLAL